MVYVALSRARTLGGLKVKNLPPYFGDGINEEVAGFYAQYFDRRD